MMEHVKIKKDDNDRKYYHAESGREGLSVPFGPDGISAERKNLDDGLLHPFRIFNSTIVFTKSKYCVTLLNSHR